MKIIDKLLGIKKYPHMITVTKRGSEIYLENSIENVIPSEPRRYNSTGTTVYY